MSATFPADAWALPPPMHDHHRIVPLRPAHKPGLQALTFEQLLAADLKPREQVLAPLIPERGLAMIYGQRGRGKTWFALSLAYAIATGSSPFDGWHAPRPQRVLLIDGEMPAAALRDRLALIAAGQGTEPPAPDFLRVLAMDAQDPEAPSVNIATPQGQQAITPLIRDADVVLVDNISTLATAADENDASAWSPEQEFLLKLRRMGKTIIVIHHAGKGGQQRGTSRREDVLDTVLALKVPSDHTPEEGARFEVRPEKYRGVAGDAVKAFQLRLVIENAAARWERQAIEDAKADEIRGLADDRLTIRQIAEKTGVSKSAVQRVLAGRRT